MPVLVRRIPSPLRRRPWAVGLLAAMAILLPAAPTRAGLVVEFNPVSVPATPGSSGNLLEVDLLNTGPAVGLAGFNITIDVPGSSGISFTSGDASTSAPYILAGDSFGPIVTNPSGSNTIELNDLANDGDAAVPPGTYGLARFFFSVIGSAAPGSVTVSVDPSTTFSDPDGSPIGYTANSGTVVISAVPEPSSLLLSGLACLSGLVPWARRARASR